MTPNRRTFLQQMGLGAAGAGLVSLLPGCAITPSNISVRGLPRSTPEAEGVASAGVIAFLDAIAASKHELHSFMMLRHGRVIAEGWWAPYGPGLNHTMYSMSKSFTSTAVGFAVAEGRLSVEDTVASIFPKELPHTVGPNLAALRVKHLLTMSVGNEKEPTGAVVKEDNWVQSFLAQPITHEPGTQFLYNSAATYMCSAIVQTITGERVVDYLQPRLFAPLGIEGATWETCPLGVNTGGWGLNIHTEGLAKFGECLRQKGAWQGRQVIPAKWVEEATRFHIQQPVPAKASRPKEHNDWLQGYGYQFWRCQHGAFRGDGAFGQFTIVMPEQDVVIAMTGESTSMQGELDLVWEHLLPAISKQPRVPEAKEADVLKRRLASLRLAPLKNQAPPSGAQRVAGRTFQIEDNALGIKNAAFTFTNDGCAVTMRDAQRGHVISAGFGSWQWGETSLPGTPPRLIAGGVPGGRKPSRIVASAAWKDAETLELMFRYIETPHHDTMTCHFVGDTVKISFLSSIMKLRALAKDLRPILIGKMVA